MVSHDQKKQMTRPVAFMTGWHRRPLKNPTL